MKEDVILVNADTGAILAEIFPSLKKIDLSTKKVDSGARLAAIAAKTREIFDHSKAETFLFAGLLFSKMGLLDKALVYLVRALELEPLAIKTKGSIHTAIADLWLARDQPDKAASHMIAAKACIEGPADPAAVTSISKPKGSLGKLLRERKLMYLKAQQHFENGEFPKAYLALADLLHFLSKKDQSLSIEFEELADIIFLFLKINRLCAVCAEPPKYEDKQFENGITGMLRSVTNTYALLQQKKKWADSLLFSAEEELRFCWLKWAVQEAKDAEKIYRKIGNEVGISRCQRLIEFVDSEHQGTWSYFYLYGHHESMARFEGFLGVWDDMHPEISAAEYLRGGVFHLLYDSRFDLWV